MKRLISTVLAVAFGLALAGPVQAQDTTPTPTTTSVVDEVNQNDDSGRWGLFGLIGLAGLAGLLRRPQTEVRTVDRTGDVR